MFKLISMTDVLPKSLFITDITTLDVIGIGGFGRVFKGKHKGHDVALKVVDQSHKSVSTILFSYNAYTLGRVHSGKTFVGKR